MPGNGKRKGSRRKSGSRVGRVVTSLSASQAWDRKLASSKDTCHLSDRMPLGLISTTSAGSLSYYQPLTITNSSGSVQVAGLFGNRVFSIGVNYLRYRINRLLACYRPIVGTSTSGLAALGFADDGGIEALQGTTASTSLIQEFRCSHSTSIYREIEVEWKPVDPSVWYYVESAASNSVSDYRFEYPGTFLFAINNGPASVNVGQVDLYYDITFDGEADNAVAPTNP